MAIGTDVDFEVRTTGNDNNGGGYKRTAGTTDYSQQDAAQDSGTNLTVDAVTNTDVIPDDYSVSSQDVGNVVNITSGGSWTPGRYQIMSIQGGTKWRFDRSPAATGTTGGVWYLGGAILSPSLAVYLANGGGCVFIKSGTYVISSTSPNAVGGILRTSANGGTSVGFSRIVGYNTVRDEHLLEANMPLIQCASTGVTSVDLVDIDHNYWSVHNIKVDGQSKSSIGGINAAAIGGFVINCIAINCTTYGINAGTTNSTIAFNCKASLCSGTAGIRSSIAAFCESFDNTCDGIVANGIINCLAYRNRGTGIAGLRLIGASPAQFCKNSTAYYNEGSGLKSDNYAIISNCILYNNSGYGIDFIGGSGFMFNNAFGANSSGTYDSPTYKHAFNGITLSSNPFTDVSISTGGASDFSLNSVADGGALCKNTGFPTDPLANTDTYNDVGISRHQDPAGGGSLMIHPGMTGGLNG